MVFDPVGKILNKAKKDTYSKNYSDTFQVKLEKMKKLLPLEGDEVFHRERKNQASIRFTQKETKQASPEQRKELNDHVMKSWERLGTRKGTRTYNHETHEFEEVE